MSRAPLLALVAALVGVLLQTGCSLQNPYALFGPAKVPAPASAEVAPYYPAGITASVEPKTDASTSRPSISVPPPAAPVPSTTKLSHTADEEPIRIAENTSISPTRKAATPPMPSVPATNQATPASPPSRPSFQAPPSARTVRDSSVVPASFQSPSPTFTESPTTPGTWRAR